MLASRTAAVAAITILVFMRVLLIGAPRLGHNNTRGSALVATTRPNTGL
jgi:hypothetical protein